MADYQLLDGGVLRTEDGAYIPECAENRDWRAYLEWVDAGGVPDPIPDPPPVDALTALREQALAKVAAAQVLTEDEMAALGGTP